MTATAPTPLKKKSKKAKKTTNSVVVGLTNSEPSRQNVAIALFIVLVSLFYQNRVQPDKKAAAVVDAKTPSTSSNPLAIFFKR